MLKRGIHLALLLLPLQLVGADFRQDLRSLYPYLSQPAFDRKLAAMETEYDFFRSFVPFFYDQIRRRSKEFEVLDQLKVCRGWCVGDPHLENFAILSPLKTRHILSLDDGDDSGPGYLTLDLLRMLTSAQLLDDELKISELLASYERGLRGGDYRLSKPLRESISRLTKNGLRPRGRDLASDGLHLKRPKASDHHRDAIELTPSERQEISLALMNLFDRAELIDGFRYIRYFGGSGGLTRYRVLARIRGGEPMTLEFKQLVGPGLSFFDPSISMPEVSERVETAFKKLQEVDRPYLYGFANISGIPMLLKPRWESNETLEQENFSKKEFRNLMVDMAYRLGEIHRGGALNLGGYLKAFDEIKNADWRSSTRVCVEIIRSAFKKIKS